MSKYGMKYSIKSASALLQSKTNSIISNNNRSLEIERADCLSAQNLQTIVLVALIENVNSQYRPPPLPLLHPPYPCFTPDPAAAAITRRRDYMKMD